MFSRGDHATHLLPLLLLLLLCWFSIETSDAQLANPEDFHECVMSETHNACAFQSLTRDTLVYPGGNSRCAFDTRGFPQRTNATYRFQVQLGSDPTKRHSHVLLFFQGGGGCTSTRQCRSLLGSNPLFSMNADPVAREGVFDDTRLDNPFRGWTRVVVLYCTGDVHSGSMTSSGPSKSDDDDDDDDSGRIHFNGRANVQSVLQWLKVNFPQPQQLLLSGCSAGSLGVQLHAERIAAMYQDVNTYLAVLPDSYPGFFPPRQGQILSELWQACDPAFGLKGEAAMDACQNGELGFVDLVTGVLKSTREIKYGYVNSKIDNVQELFYCVGNQSLVGCIDQPEYYQGVQDTLRQYTATNKGQVANYLMNVKGHCFLNKNDLYDITTGGMKLTKWIQQFILTPEELALYPTSVPERVIASECQVSEEDDNSENKVDLTCDATLGQAQVKWTMSPDKDSPKSDASISTLSWILPLCSTTVWIYCCLT